MAESEKKEAGASGEGDQPKKGLPIKLIGIIAGIMVVEAVAVFVLVGMTGGAPAKTNAEEVSGHAEAESDHEVEILLVDDRFQNMQTGKVWVWKAEVYLKVKSKHEEAVTLELEQRSAEIKEAIGQIMRRANHAHLKEPDLRTLNRQLSALVHEIFGKDHDGEHLVDRVIIARCEGFETG